MKSSQKGILQTRSNVLFPEEFNASAILSSLVNTPEEVIQKHGADVLRYWAVSATLGEDLIYREQDITRGAKIMIKLFITDYKKISLYGDADAIDETTIQYRFRGKSIRVKILGMFWTTYKYYTI